MTAYSIETVEPRYFEIVQPGGKNVLHIESPKVRTVAKIQKVDDSDVEAVSEIVAEIISKNKEGYTLTASQVQDLMDIDQMTDFFMAFFSWLNSEKAADPN